MLNKEVTRSELSLISAVVLTFEIMCLLKLLGPMASFFLSEAQGFSFLRVKFPDNANAAGLGTTI